MPAMDDIIKRYKGKITSQGHKLDLKATQGIITIGFKHSGEFEDEYDPYIRVARIELAGDTYTAGWFHDDGEEPSDSSEYASKEDLFAAVDAAIAQRSQEVGPMGD
jgi:hypothetical protein